MSDLCCPSLALVSQLNQLKADYRKEQKTSSERALQLEAEEVCIAVTFL